MASESRIPTDAQRLVGRRTLITGAARGIGAEIAGLFCSHGADLVLADVAADDLAAVADRLDAHAVVVDLADAAATAEAVRAAANVLGGLDVLVNNAGILQMASILELTVENWDRTFDINVRSMFVTTKVAAGVMREQSKQANRRGTIINMASMGGKVGSPNQAHYAASKAAVIAFTRVTAMELGPFDITANCICPGYVLTEMGASTRTDDKVRAWSAMSPLGRLAEPRDVANMALFLASDDASYCTGQAMNVSGGMVMH